MAKSERRSRWKKKMRAMKRVKMEPKELARLEKILPKVDINMKDMEEIAQVKNLSKPIGDDENMQVDSEGKKYSSKTMRDENGQYPPWMNQRAVKKLKKRLQSSKKSKKSKK